MKVEIKDIEKSRKEFSLELPPESYDNVYKEKLEKFALEAKIPGFRKGKIPLDIVRKQFHHKINAEAFEKVINDAVLQALKDSKISPLSAPNVENVEFKKDGGITFKILVDVFPDVNLSKYKDIDFMKEKITITDKEIEEAINMLKKKHSSFEPAAEGRIVTNGDMVSLDYYEQIEESSERELNKDFVFITGSNELFKDFEDQVLGMKKGEKKIFTLHYPEDYIDKKFSGKKVTYEVGLNEIKEMILPELDDDFAKEINEKFETADDIKRTIVSEMEAQKELSSTDKLINDILTKLIGENPFDLPESMIIQQADRLALQSIQNYQQMYGVKQEELNVTKEKLRDNFRGLAEFQVKGALLVNKIAEKESIEINDEEIYNKIKEIADRAGGDFEEYKKQAEKEGGLELLRNNLISDKVYRLLMDVNNIKEAESKPLEKEEGNLVNEGDKAGLEDKGE